MFISWHLCPFGNLICWFMHIFKAVVTIFHCISKSIWPSPVQSHTHLCFYHCCVKQCDTHSRAAGVNMCHVIICGPIGGVMIFRSAAAILILKREKPRTHTDSLETQRKWFEKSHTVWWCFFHHLLSRPAETFIYGHELMLTPARRVRQISGASVIHSGDNTSTIAAAAAPTRHLSAAH